MRFFSDLLASLILVKDGLFPLVVTRDDKVRYLEALEEADRGDLRPLVDLFAKLQISQYRKATAISEGVPAEQGVQAELDRLFNAADRIAADKLESLRGVFDLAGSLQDDLEVRLRSISTDVAGALRRVDDSATAAVRRSDENTSYYFRAQIIETAKSHVGYFADMSEYKAWIALDLRWLRRAQLVFSIHGIGKPFNGSLICAPFLEFKDTDEDNQTRASLVQVAEEGFVFFYNEDRDRLLTRFAPWRENVLEVALKELTQNL